jgi:serpin B
MNNIGYADYYRDEHIQMIRLPYKRNSISMCIALTDGNYVDYESIFGKFDRKRVSISMPKFTIEFELKLNDILKQLGIIKAFDSNLAKLRSMFYTPEGSGYENTDYYIDKATHKTYINVDENGTEAAAVTVITIMPTSVPEDPIIFIADKPFVFFIRDDENGEILFMGEYLFAK